MKRIAVLALFLLSLHGLAQLPDGTYMGDRRPWVSDYLPATLDQMVSGEQYNGYPGPLPKLFMALGLDPASEGVSYELQHHVRRDAESWIGVCHGWALASINHPEPQGFVVNGIRFMPGDLKAILTSIYKNNRTVHLSQPRETGVSARDFHNLLENRLAQGDNFVFDVSLTYTVWNYPLAGFTKTTTVADGYTNVTAVLHFTSFQSLNDNLDVEDFKDLTYTYRYIPGDNKSFEWTGDSVDDHPHNAWIARIPYKEYLWVLTANHFFNLETYYGLEAQSQDPDSRIDLFEPNDAMEDAFNMTSEVVLASALPGDTDFFKVTVAPGETRTLDLSVYHGLPLNVSVYDAEGNVIDLVEESRDFQFNLNSTVGEDFFIKVVGTHDFGDVYYKVVQDRDMGSLRVPHAGRNDLHLAAVNTTDDVISILGQGDVAVDSARVLETDADLIRSSGPTVWSVASVQDGHVAKKKYYRDHDPLQRCIVPHITFKFGWDTRLEFTSRNQVQQVALKVYGSGNHLLEEVALPLDGGVFSGSLRNVLSESTRAKATWFEVSSTYGDQLFGDVIFDNEILGVSSRVDMASAPRTGEMVVTDLKSAAEGWTGVALLNSAEVENQVYFSIEDGSGDELMRDVVMLQPGEKWLFTPKSLLGFDITNRYFVRVHAQYTIESLVIQADMAEGFSYGHRLQGEKLDHFDRSYIVLPENKEGLSLMFTNMGDKTEYVLLEGYNAAGELQGKFNLNLRSPLAKQETRIVPFEQLRSNGVQVKDFDSITLFKVRTSVPVSAFEMYGDEGGRLAVPLLRYYENP